ncbi:hypothetical protein AAFN47_24795 [Hoeflea sp. CAU 1731]
MAPVSDSLKNNVAHALPPDVAGVLKHIIGDVGIPGQLFGKPFLHCTPDEAQSEFFAQIGGGADAFDLDLKRDIVSVDWGPGVEFLEGAHADYTRQKEAEP